MGISTKFFFLCLNPPIWWKLDGVSGWIVPIPTVDNQLGSPLQIGLWSLSFQKTHIFLPQYIQKVICYFYQCPLWLCKLPFGVVIHK